MANLTAKKPGKIVACRNCGQRVDDIMGGPDWHCCPMETSNRRWRPSRGNVVTRLLRRLRGNV